MVSKHSKLHKEKPVSHLPDLIHSLDGLSFNDSAVVTQMANKERRKHSFNSEKFKEYFKNANK